MVLDQLEVKMQKNANWPIIISFYKAQVQVDHEPSHKTRYTEAYRGENGEELEQMGTGENFLNRIPVAYALRTRIDKAYYKNRTS